MNRSILARHLLMSTLCLPLLTGCEDDDSTPRHIPEPTLTASARGDQYWSDRPIKRDLSARVYDVWRRIVIPDDCDELPADAKALLQRQLDHFIGYIEGSLRTKVPGFWSRNLHQVRKSGKYIVCGTAHPDRKSSQKNGYGIICKSIGSVAFRRDDELVIRMDQFFFVVRDFGSALDGIRDHTDEANEIAVDFRGPRLYIAPYSVQTHIADLYCIDNASGKPLWKSPIVGKRYHRVQLRGALRHTIYIDAAGEYIVVFGLATGACYIEAFDHRTGELVFRFITHEQSQ